MSLIIALPRERRPSERRVALDPSRVERLLQAGLQVRIEEDCGHTASFHDDDYKGAIVCESFAEVVRNADIVVKVVCPTADEISHLSSGMVLVCIMSAFQHLEEVEMLRAAGVTLIAMDHMPRTTRAQPMDALSSQATVAGYKAALLAAELSPRLFPMLTTAAGTIRPSRVLVIGAGVAGLQAIATARRLGAQVAGYDIRRAAKEQIESLGARTVDTGVEVEGAGGFARPLRKDEKQKQHDALAEHIARAHVVICAASIPGRRAPRIITEDMVDGMLPESVIIDLAASSGGNCELTHVGEHYYHHETLIVGPLNLPSHGAVHASEMYARNVHSMLQLIISDNAVVLDHDDDIIARSVVCHAHQVNHAPTAGLMEIEHTAFGGAVHTAADFTDDFPDDSAGWLDDAVEEEGKHSLEKANNRRDTAETSQILANSVTAGGETEPTNDNTAGAAAKASDLLDNKHSVADRSIDSAVVGTDAHSATEQQMGTQGTGSRPAGEMNSASRHEMLHADHDESQTEPDEPMPDDLTRIDGVGPALQECLYAFGFRFFEDIAGLDENGVQKLTVQLELEDEVKQQDWPAQARALMRGQNR